jgi:hypothetical protein
VLVENISLEELVAIEKAVGFPRWGSQLKMTESYL